MAQPSKYILTALVALLALPAAAGTKKAAPPPAANARDPQLLELASDGEVQFVDVKPGIPGRILSRAPVLLDVRGLDGMVSAALVRELVTSGKVDVVERDALRDERELRADAPSAPAPSGKGAAAVAAPVAVRAFELSAESLLVDAPREPARWQPPESLVQWRTFDSPHAPSVLGLLGEIETPKGAAACGELRWIDAATGTVRWNGLGCSGDSEADLKALRASLLADAQKHGDACAGNPRVLQLPVQRGESEGGGLGSDYRELNEALAASGCQVVDVPPGAEKPGSADVWSYHRRAFDLVGATRLKGWVPARYAVQVTATKASYSAESLRMKLKAMDEQLLDPDLVRMGDKETVATLRIDVKAVDLTNGRIVSETRIDVGAAAPGQVIASFIADSILSRTPSAWVELRPLPSTAEVRVDRVPATTHRGVGLVRLDGGKHAADLVFAGSAKVEASASFTLRTTDYGVLAMAAPNAALEVATTCENSSIVVDGQSWGEAPVTKTTGLGEHVVVASVEGWGQVQETVPVTLGETNRVLLHLPGTLLVTAVPAEATISIAGVSESKAGSMEVNEVPFGPREVTWHLEGYPDHTETIEVGSCRITNASYTFHGTIRVAGSPDRSEVRVDQEAQGRAPLDIIVRPGQHDVGCYWCEYGSASTTVQVDAGRTTDVELDLNGKGASTLT